MAPRPWRLLAIALLIITVVVVTNWQHRRRQVNTLRRLRHRHANHLQVIQGWLQLGRTERAQAYVHRVTERMGEEGSWYRSLPLSWLYSVLMLDVLAESRGIRCQWHISAVTPAWIRLYRFQSSVHRAMACAGTALDVHLDERGFVIALLDPKAVPRVPLGVKLLEQGDTIVLVWHDARREPSAVL
jgi:hypothetical protein